MAHIPGKAWGGAPRLQDIYEGGNGTGLWEEWGEEGKEEVEVALDVGQGQLGSGLQWPFRVDLSELDPKHLTFISDTDYPWPGSSLEKVMT